MRIVDHWLSSAIRVASPNADARPDPGDISLIVLHGISLPPGEFGSDAIDRLFTNTLDATEHSYFAEICHLKVSAHVLIRRDGTVVQYVPFHQRAWHAGASSFLGRPCCNDYSIGIELEGTEHSDFETAQYIELNRLVEALLGTYPGLSSARIAAHSEVAPGRKRDPGPRFDWARLKIPLSR
jgi:AmpD protein